MMSMPMYIFLCNLCVNDLCGTTGFYPRAFAYLLTETNRISLEECIVQGLVIVIYAVGELKLHFNSKIEVSWQFIQNVNL